MIKGLKVIALIPARGNSKSVHRKNLIVYKGLTLLETAILCAKHSRYVDDIIVNSEDAEILETASKIGVKAFKRDPALASDKSKSNELIQNFILNFEMKEDFYIMYLQPTSPLRTSSHVDSICELVNNSRENCVISVTQINNKILKSFFISNGNLLPISHTSYITENRQELPRVFASNGAAYLFKKSDFMYHGNIPVEGAIPFVMDSETSIDIDDLSDYEYLTDLNKK
jgi:CMP-N,N'-diacetyllegionaminic acid synthase